MTDHVGACVIVLDKHKKSVLLGKRLNGYRAGTLGLPGGRVEIDEALEICAKRELEEETSLQTDKLKYIGVIRELQKINGYFIHFVFACSDFTGIPKVMEPNKCERWKWYPLNKLPGNILPGHKAALDIYLHPNEPSFKDLLTKE